MNLKAGGPGVFPPLPKGLVTRGGWKKEVTSSEGERLSVYVFVRRNTRYPMFEVFDMPDTHESCARRNTTITAPQALELLNNDLVGEWSRAMAARVMNDSGLTPEAEADRAWKPRLPNAEERASAMADLCQMLLNSNEFVWLLGLDHVSLTYMHNDRAERPTITDGELIEELFA